MTQEQKAEQAWKEYTNKRFDDIHEGINGAIKGQFQLTAISDFKSSLKREIEKRINEFENYRDRSIDEDHKFAYQCKILEDKMLLELLNTVEP